MAFNPKEHLIQLPQRKFDEQTRQWVNSYADYLEVKYRLVWFREEFPHGTIQTDPILLDWEKGIAVFKATVSDGEGGVATGTGTEIRLTSEKDDRGKTIKKGFEDFVEKAETRAVGRALAALGIGTQFVGEELSEGGHIADAPVVSSLAETEVSEPPSQDPADLKPTKDQVDTLVSLGLSACNQVSDRFAREVRRVLDLPGETKISKTYLRTIPMTQYLDLYAAFEAMNKAEVEQSLTDVPDHDPPASATDTIQDPTVEEDKGWTISNAIALQRRAQQAGIDDVAWKRLRDGYYLDAIDAIEAKEEAKGAPF